MTTMMPLPGPHHRRRGAAVLLLLLLSLACSASAQSPSSNSPGAFPNGWNNARFNPSMAIIVVVLICAFFFMGFFSIYLRQCSDRADPTIRPAGVPGARSRRAAARGLDAAVIQTFPTLVYADVKEHKIGKSALECAVCLSEFEDDDTLRLLPKCDHVFHPDCIDAWLSAHTTCPVCRANLSPDPNVPPAAPAIAPPVADPAAASSGEEATAAAVDSAGSDERQTEGVDQFTTGATPAAAAAGQSDHVVIAIEEPATPEPAQKKGESFPTLPAADRVARVESKRRLPWRSKSSLRPLRFPRSHSTGHSLTVVRPGEDCERYTLRLPEHIRQDIMAGKLQRFPSCASFAVVGEGSTRNGGYGGAEGSSRGGGSIGGRSFKLRRWDWVAKSDRWAFFGRNFSMRLPRGDGAWREGSTRRGEGSARRGCDGGDTAAADGSVKAKAFPGARSPFDCLGSGGGAGADEAATASANKAAAAGTVS